MKSIIIALVFTISAFVVFAQSITSISPAQRTDGSMLVDISYDLAGPEPEYNITVEASFDNGFTFAPINNMTGDVGLGIVPGTGKAIIWDFSIEFPDQYSNTTQVRLTASLFVPLICGDDLVDERDSQTYTTIQIGSQCWMAENINIGIWVNSNANQTNNGIIEKYCYSNNENICNTYGGLYQWDEMMQSSTTIGTQGICPTGWHLPTDAEWCILENEVDAGTISCGSTGYRGIDAGGNLKVTGTAHWYPTNIGATNSSGFTALGAGYRLSDGTATLGIFNFAKFWTSNENGSNAWLRDLGHNHASIVRYHESKDYGYSVRCIQN